MYLDFDYIFITELTNVNVSEIYICEFSMSEKTRFGNQKLTDYSYYSGVW